MRILLLTVAGTVLLLPAAVLVATIAAAISLARDEDEEEHDCGGTCPAHDVGPDDLEAVARVTGLVVFNAPTLADVTEDDLVDGLAERATCPDYPHEIVWSES